MSFSFNPGQQVPQQQGVPGQALQPSSAMVAAAPPSVPDSPFLFMQHRDQEMTVNAYLQIILIMVNIVVITVAVVMFLYSSYLTSTIQSNKDKLASMDSSFATYNVADMQRLSSRISSLSSVLHDYVSVRSALKLLEDVVEKQVVFNDFSLTKKSTGHVAVFTVVTTNYRSLIQQLSSLNLTEYKKIAPEPKFGKVSDGITAIKVVITTPVFVQGVLPDSIVFVPASSSTSETPQQINTVSASSTSQ